MASCISFEPIDGDDPRLGPLIVEARAQGYPFIDTLVREWIDGANRFDRSGECYLAAIAHGAIVGVGGINRDPYCDRPGTGRIRHVYILDRQRRCGFGKALLAELVGRARGEFDWLRLRTRTERGAAFYQSIGFTPVSEEYATHVMQL